VQQPDWLDSKAVQGQKSPRVQGDIEEFRYVRAIQVAMLCVDVGVDSVKCVKHEWFRINSNRLTHQSVVSANFIEAEDMVDVRMGDQDSITPIKPVPQCLLTMIWWNID
jgi:hypothetical protein